MQTTMYRGYIYIYMYIYIEIIGKMEKKVDTTIYNSFFAHCFSLTGVMIAFLFHLCQVRSAV